MWHQVIKPNGPIELSCSNVPGGPGLYYLVDPVVSSELLVKSRFKFFCFAEFCGSIGLGGRSVRLDSVVSLRLIPLVL